MCVTKTVHLVKTKQFACHPNLVKPQFSANKYQISQALMHISLADGGNTFNGVHSTSSMCVWGQVECKIINLMVFKGSFDLARNSLHSMDSDPCTYVVWNLQFRRLWEKVVKLYLVKVVIVKSCASATPTFLMVKVDLSYAHYYIF